MWLTLYYIFCYLIFSYTLALIVTYVIMVIMSKRKRAGAKAPLL